MCVCCACVRVCVCVWGGGGGGGGGGCYKSLYDQSLLLLPLKLSSVHM